MNFRRQPFQFSSIDPAKRQAELQKRFGSSIAANNMLVDFLNPGMMPSRMKGSPVDGSPRLQHRVPSFTDSADKADSIMNNIDGGHKPRVRVVPIQVEGLDGGTCHRVSSGLAATVNGNNFTSKGKLQEAYSHLDSSKDVEKPKIQSQSRECIIPIQVEPREEKHKIENSPKAPKSTDTTESKSCAASSEKEAGSTKKLKAELNDSVSGNAEEERRKSVVLNQIANVLDRLNVYKEEVERFSGTCKDKKYRYLDEMLTRCMLDLDNIDLTELPKLRLARKDAVRQVQRYVDLLDTKVNEQVEKMDVISSADNPEVDTKREDTCNLLSEANNAARVDTNECEESNCENKVVSTDIEMSSDIAEMHSAAVPDSKIDNESSEITNKIKMPEADILEDSPEVIGEKMEISDQDSLKIAESVDSDQLSTEVVAKDSNIEGVDVKVIDSVIGENLSKDDFINNCDSLVDSADRDEQLVLKHSKVIDDSNNATNFESLTSNNSAPMVQKDVSIS